MRKANLALVAAAAVAALIFAAWTPERSAGAGGAEVFPEAAARD